MNDEGHLGKRSVDTVGYSGDSDSDSDETGSFFPGSLRFSSPAAENPTSDIPAAGGFSLGPDAFSAKPEYSAEPDFSAEPEPEPEPAAAAEDSYKPGASLEPAVSDVFTRPAFFGRPEPRAEPESSAGPESSDVFTRPELPARPDYSDFFTRPTFFPNSDGGHDEAKPSEEPRYSLPAEPRYHTPDEPRHSFQGETRYSPLDEPWRPAPGEPSGPSLGDTRYSGPQRTPYSGPRQTPYSGPRETPYSGPKETPYSAPVEPRYPTPGNAPFSGMPPENRTERAGEPVKAHTPEPAVTVEVPGKPAAQHPVRSTGELSVLRPPERPVGIDARLPDGLWGYDGYPVAENAQPADDQAGVVSLGYIGGAIKRKKKVWCLTTALGILVAGGLYATHHESYTNTTTVLLALDPNLDAATAIQTDAILADDSTMAQQAMQKLGLHESVATFLKTYTVTVSTNADNLLTFTAAAASPTAAYNETNTLATTFLNYRAQTELEKESANTTAQDQQVAQTQQTVNSLNSQIKKLKDEGVASGDSRLTRLQTELSDAQTLLASLQSNVASANATSRSTTAQLIAGSSVLDTGIPAEGVSKKKFAVEYGGGAIFGGLVIGLLIVAIGAILSDRLRRRDDVAAALGAPVVVSVASGGKRSGKAGREGDLKRVAAHLRASVPSGSGGSGSLVVVAVDDTKFASEAIREAAVTAAREGKRVVVADLAGGALGALFGAREPGIRGVDASGARMVLVTPDRGDFAPVGPLHAPMLGTPMNGIENVHSAADLFITLATVNPATGAAHLKTWADDAVAVVTAGASSVTRVQAVGEMVRFADARLTSAVLLGADEKDESLGFAAV